MRKLVVMASLGCLALATAADAQFVEAGPVECAYGYGDHDLVVEIARLDHLGTSGLTLA